MAFFQLGRFPSVFPRRFFFPIIWMVFTARTFTLNRVSMAFADPEQCRLRVATDRRSHQILQRIEQAGLLHRGWLASSPGPADAARAWVTAGAQFRQAAPNRAARHAGCRRRRSDAATTRCARFAGRNETAHPLISKWRQRREPRPDGRNIDHTDMIPNLLPVSQPIFRIRSLRIYRPADSFQPDSLISSQVLSADGAEP